MDSKKVPKITEKDLSFINTALQRGNKVHIEIKDTQTVIVTEYKFSSKHRIKIE